MEAQPFFKLLDATQSTEDSRRLDILLTHAPDSEEGLRLRHDLQNSLTVLRMTLHVQIEALQNSAAPRDHRKSEQLKGHLDRVSHAVAALNRLLSGQEQSL